MARDDERSARSRQEPLVGGLPDVPGILAAIRLTPGFGVHMRGLADELLVKDFPGAGMDSHGAFASELLERGGVENVPLLVDGIKRGRSDGVSEKMRALLNIARTVRREPRGLVEGDVAYAREAGATDADVQLAVLIAAAFSMYNRMVDGFRAKTPPDAAAYRTRAAEIASHGYSDQRATSVPS